VNVDEHEAVLDDHRSIAGNGVVRKRHAVHCACNAGSSASSISAAVNRNCAPGLSERFRHTHGPAAIRRIPIGNQIVLTHALRVRLYTSPPLRQ